MVLRHVVLFGFANGTSEQTISDVVRRFGDLKLLVPDVLSFEWGQNCSVEGLDKGHTHAFVLTFPSEEARDVYLPHPAHKAFADWAGPHLSSVTVVDYWANHAPDE
jgi:Stress responsive A/B Barrel Domain